MNFIAESLGSIREFFEAGGNVLWAILAATILMWTFIIERLWFYFLVLPSQVKAVSSGWNARKDTSSWWARRIREQSISEVSVEANHYILIIKTLMAILPLLGLLGTVTGMIRVFDVMAFSGTGNARAMARGVSSATIPTMAGLVSALSGLYPVTYLENRARTEVERVEDLLSQH